MLFTDEGMKVPSQIYPLAFANGVEWSTRRRGHKDRFDCLYRNGIGNKALWYLGALAALVWRPSWVGRKGRACNVPRLPRPVGALGAAFAMLGIGAGA